MAKTDNSSQILLESGTNELGVMEFTIAGNVFGINVSKLNKIMKFEPVKPMPGSHPFVEGIFKPRDKILTVIDLAAYMGLPPSECTDRNYFIITNFNNMEVAFHVHTVEGIHRISWGNIEKPDAPIYGGSEGLATGIAKVGSKLITIVDFEKIIFDIAPETGITPGTIQALRAGTRNTRPIFIVEDSQLLKHQILEAVHTAGYENVFTFDNGQEAWSRMEEVRNAVQHEGRPLESMVACVITDIEMPKMDGHCLTRKIKEDPLLKKLPVLIFSSLINQEMYMKGQTLGADAQLSKPEIGHLMQALDEWVL